MSLFFGASSHHDHVSYHLREFARARTNATNYTRTEYSSLFPIVVPRSVVPTTVVLPGGHLRGICIILLKNTEQKRAGCVCVKNMHDVIS